jgi:hypothetical protein
MSMSKSLVVLVVASASAAAGFSLACGSESAPAGPTSATTRAQNPAPIPTPTPTPSPAKYSVAGVVREVNGAPLAGVSVTTGPAPGPATTTDGAGVFSLAEVTQNFVTFQKAGFVFTFWNVPANFGSGSSAPVSVKMQPRLDLSADAGVSSVITNDDLSYSDVEGNSFWNGTYSCSPCKEIWIVPNRDGGRFHLHWTGPVPLDLWVGQYYSTVPAYAAGVDGESDLVLVVPAGSLDTVLVGVGPRNGAPQKLTATATFNLTIER